MRAFYAKREKGARKRTVFFASVPFFFINFAATKKYKEYVS